MNERTELALTVLDYAINTVAEAQDSRAVFLSEQASMTIIDKLLDVRLAISSLDEESE